MHAADAVLWQYAGEQHIVPVAGLHEIPPHIRGDLSRWLRRQALPCPHSVALALSGVVFRVAGRADAWCPSCALEAGIPAITTTCARCARYVGNGGQRVAFSIAGHALIFGAWCAGCWNGDDE